MKLAKLTRTTMCGIAGLIDPSSSAAEARAHLQRMLDLIAHRGPDGAGTARRARARRSACGG